MSGDIKTRSEEHLMKPRAVYRKNPQLIDEFVSALKFECRDNCKGCIFLCKGAGLSDSDQFCAVLCSDEILRLAALMGLIRGNA